MNDNAQSRLHALVDELFSGIMPQAKLVVIDNIMGLAHKQRPTHEELLTDVERAQLAEANALWPEYVATVLTTAKYRTEKYDTEQPIRYHEHINGYENQGIFLGYTLENMLIHMRHAIAAHKAAQS